MIITVHGGHNRKAPGTSALIDEVTEDRKVKDLVIAKLRALGHTVYDCTDDNGSTANACLSNICKLCNAHSNADLNVSIHFNSAANDLSGDGKTTGTEVWVYDQGNAASVYGKRICTAIAELGYRNRGVNATHGLYVINHTKRPTVLVECCFADDADDVRIYNADKMAAAIVKGITGQTVTSTPAAGYRVRITTATLNVRKDHSASSAVTTTVKRGDVYTIVDEYNNGGTMWGKLKSGAGWIALRYTERV